MQPRRPYRAIPQRERWILAGSACLLMIAASTWLPPLPSTALVLIGWWLAIELRRHVYQPEQAPPKPSAEPSGPAYPRGVVAGPSDDATPDPDRGHEPAPRTGTGIAVMPGPPRLVAATLALMAIPAVLGLVLNWPPQLTFWVTFIGSATLIWIGRRQATRHGIYTREDMPENRWAMLLLAVTSLGVIIATLHTRFVGIGLTGVSAVSDQARRWWWRNQKPRPTD